MTASTAMQLYNLPILPGADSVPRRTPLQRVFVAVPLFGVVALTSALLLARRALGLPHPHAWTLHEEMLINLMCVLLRCGDIGAFGFV
jgi:hypothetical protein